MNILVLTLSDPEKRNTGSENISKKHIEKLKEANTIKTIDISEFKKIYKNKIFRYIYYFLYFLVGVPVSVSSMKSRRLKKIINNIIEKDKIDLILTYGIAAIQYCPEKYLKRLIANLEDPPSLKLKRMANLKIMTITERAKIIINYKITKIYENRIFPKIKTILLLSKHDIKDYKKFSNIKHITYGVGIDIDDQVLSYSQREKYIIISGNMNHPPNVDGVLFFLNKIFPLILNKKENIKLYIVGTNPVKKIYRDAKKYKDNVIITGKVDNINSYIKKAIASVCAVKLKIGVQTKILEALSIGTPVVTTMDGNSGVNGVSGRDLWATNDDKEFANKLIELIEGKAWANLSYNGRLFVKNNFSWEKSYKELQRYIKELYIE